MVLGLDAYSWLTLGVLAAIALALLRDIARPDLVFLAGLGVLLVTGVITPGDAFSGFANSAVITVGALFVVAAGIEETGALRAFDRILFGRSRSLSWSLPRLMLPTACLSAFINNTPIVAMLTQPVQQWAARIGISPSKVLIPLSYSAIAGGMVTLMGTSTNVIVSGLLVQAGHPPFGLFDLTRIGVLAVVVVVAFMATIGFRLLPDGDHAQAVSGNGLQECLFEARIGARAPIIGHSIEEAGLRALRNAYLVHVRRGDRVMSATGDFVLAHGDVLAFNGDVAALEELLRRPGLEPGVAMAGGRATRTLPLFEAVVSDTSYLVGKSLRDVQFQERYGAVVLAVQRKSERIEGPLGRVPLKAGDLLFIGAAEGFDEHWNASRTEFYLVAARGASRMKQQPVRAFTALFILVAMILAVGAQLLPLVTASFAAALAMIFTGCLNMTTARRALNLQILILIAAALGLGQAVAKTGLTEVVADGLLGLSSLGVGVALVALYVSTNVLTELVTHKAAAVLMLPVALAMAVQLGVEPKAFALTVAVAAAASFMTPVGYQTNLMVMAAGEYRVRDYLRVGLPISLLVMVAAISVIYFQWI